MFSTKSLPNPIESAVSKALIMYGLALLNLTITLDLPSTILVPVGLRNDNWILSTARLFSSLTISGSFVKLCLKMTVFIKTSKPKDLQFLIAAITYLCESLIPVVL